MPALISLRKIASPTAHLANRLFCGARIALAGKEPDKVQRAVEILEVAPEHQLVSPAFDPIYKMLVPLYLEHNIFEQTLQSPDYDQRDADMFQIAFERFNALVKSPLNLRVNHYLRSLAESAVKEKPPVSPEMLEFFKYCQRTDDIRAIRRQRSQILHHWLKGKIAEPGAPFSHSTIRHPLYGNSNVYLRGTEGNPMPVTFWVRAKRGRKLAYVYDSSGETFLGKNEFVSSSETRSLTLGITLLRVERGRLIMDWLEGCGTVPEDKFLFQKDTNNGLVSLFQQLNRCRLALLCSIPLPKEEIQGFEKYFQKDRHHPGKFVFRKTVKRKHVLKNGDPRLFSLWEKSLLFAVQFLDREGEKMALVFNPEDLSFPLAEYRIFKDEKDQFSFQLVDQSEAQKARLRGKKALSWLKGETADPQEALEYHVGERGLFTFTFTGAEQIRPAGLAEFYMAIPFQEKDITGFEEWLREDKKHPGHFYFKLGIDYRRVMRAHNHALQLLWRASSRIKVHLATTEGEKFIIVSQEESGLPSRRFKLDLREDGSCAVTYLDPNSHMVIRERLQRTKDYLTGKKTKPAKAIPLPVRRNGSIDLLIIGGKRLTLQGLAACKYFSAGRAGKLVKKYPHLLVAGKKTVHFKSTVGIKDIEKTQDQELIKLWEETHQAAVSFREEYGGMRIVEIRHIETNKLAAEFEIKKDGNGFFTAVPLTVSAQQARVECGRLFADWILRSKPAPANPYEFVHSRGKIFLFRYRKKRVAVSLGMYFLTKFKASVSAEEKNGNKFIRVRFHELGRDFERVFQIQWQGEDIIIEETAESRAKIDALPEDLRRRYTRGSYTRGIRKEKPRPRKTFDEQMGTPQSRPRRDLP